ncbi:hypothetical protein BST81_15110 [Leptolyngbya sp. 'hensonii']|nr:hypothetical protein BST81_15110 [Leptolyngbya sp. 'hensonii']
MKILKHTLAYLVLVSLLSPLVGTIAPVSAAPQPSYEIAKSKPRKPSGTSDYLSPSRVNILRQDLSRRIGIPPGKIRVTSVTQATWPNTCLGLPTPGEVCGQALVEGWRVVLVSGSQSWTYRTDANGQVYRLEESPAPQTGLPQAIADRVLQDAAQRTSLPLTTLRIVRAERRTWPNGCLGLSRSGEMCTQALVPGWRVVVLAGPQRLAYRTNDSGSVIRLESSPGS